MVKFLSLIVVLVAMLLCGSLAAPVAQAGRANRFDVRIARADARRDARVANAFGGPVVLHRGGCVGGCGSGTVLFIR